MPIVKTQLRESSAKRNNIEGKLKLGKLKTDIAINDLREIKQGEDNAAKGAILEYKFKTEYSLEEPKGKSLGEISVVGELVLVEKKETIDALLKEWKKNKKLEGDVLSAFLNVAFENAQIEAIEQARKVGLPSPVPLLRLKNK